MTLQKPNSVSVVVIIIIVCTWITNISAQKVSASFITAYGYDSCVRLANGSTEVILEPNAGGRVIRYSLLGINVLYEDSTQNGWIGTSESPRMKGHIAGGRFDIGPSRTKPNTDLFFFGKWKAEVTGTYAARMTSQVDPVFHIYLVRDFVLDENTTHLRCTQTLVNVGSQSFYGSFWARTFGAGGGICVMPVPQSSRFPNKYVRFENRDSINIMPRDNNVYVENNHLIIKGPPLQPKLEMDVASPAWIAYAEQSGLLFLKKFPVYHNKQYGDITAANTSIWYNGMQMTEIEPIGPLEEVKHGARCSFTEDWYIAEFPFPPGRRIDVSSVKRILITLK